MSKLRFKLNLILLSGVFSVLFLTYNHLKVNYGRQKILEDVVANSSVVDYKYKIEFEKVLERWCHPKNVNTNYICLDQINVFDEKFPVHRYLKPNCTRINFHTFWQFDVTNELFYRMLKLNIMSFLATQNLNCTKLNLWTLENFSTSIENKINTIFENYIKTGVVELQKFDLLKLCQEAKWKQTHFSKSSVCMNSNFPSISNIQNLIGLSDLVRFFVLDLFGGIYVDGDVLFLKDMSILAEYTFAYRWSYTNNINTAVMGLNPNRISQNKNMFDLFLNNPKSNKNDIHALVMSFHPYQLSSRIRSRTENNDDSEIFMFDPLRVFHSCLFDPVWVCYDGKIANPNPKFVCGLLDFTNQRLTDRGHRFKREDFFPGAFAYHLHLSSNGFNVVDDSYFKHFENYLLNYLKLKRLK